VAFYLAGTALGAAGSQTAVSISLYYLMPKNRLNNGLFYISAPA
jgi:hypothetical protein